MIIFNIKIITIRSISNNNNDEKLTPGKLNKN